MALMKTVMMSGAGGRSEKAKFGKQKIVKVEIRGQRSEVSGQGSSVCSLQSVVCGLRSIRGFTLLELLIVIGLMVVLAGLMIPAFHKVQVEGKNRRSETESAIIASAIQAYKLRAGHFPAPTDDLTGGSDVAYGRGESEDNRWVMNELRDADPPVLDEGKFRWDSNGNVLNPWDQQYRIVLDLDYDGRVDGGNRVILVH